jgi:hypothetical protein
VGKTEARKYATGNIGNTAINSPASYLRCTNNLRRVTRDDGSRICTNRKTVRYERLEPAVLDTIMTVALDNDRYNVSEISKTRIALAESERQLEHHRGSLENIKANLKLKVSATLMDMLVEIEDKITATQAERDALRAGLHGENGAQPSVEFLGRIAQTRAAMSHPDHDTRRDARTMVHDSLCAVVTDLRCDREANTVVVVANGLAAFRVNNVGEIDWRYDASGDPQALVALTTEAFAANASLVDSVIKRAKRAA